MGVNGEGRRVNGAVRCGAVRCDAGWCGAVRCGAVRCGAVRCGEVRGGAVRCGEARCGEVRELSVIPEGAPPPSGGSTETTNLESRGTHLSITVYDMYVSSSPEARGRMCSSLALCACTGTT
jgi:hypothetical protein